MLLPTIFIKIDIVIKKIIKYVFSFNSIILCVKNESCQRISADIRGIIIFFASLGREGIIYFITIKISLSKKIKQLNILAKKAITTLTDFTTTKNDSVFLLIFQSLTILGWRAMVNGKIIK